MKYTFLIPATFLLLILSAFTTVDTQPITIFTIGDSTMADYNTQNGYQGRGWAQMLPCFLTEANVKIENHASSGRSTLSFINEGRWDKVLSRLKKGDYVFIQFGHNDEKTTKELHTVPGGSFDENLRKFIRETRAKGAYPVLFNSIVRRNYPPSGYVGERKDRYETEGDILVDTHGEYVVAPRRVAKEMNVPFVDMTRLTHDLVTQLGPEGSTKLYMWIPAGVYDAHPDGKIDNTHLNIYGGKVVAEIAVREVVKVVPALVPFVRYHDPDVYVADYKDNKTCAVCYTFDDGLKEHYTLVFPEMEKVGFKGTFYVCGKIIEEKEAQQGKPRMTWKQMKEMSDNGHEIGNHSWSHPNLKNLSTEEVRTEIGKNDSIILANIGKKPLSFCYPGNSFNEEIICMASEGRVGTRTRQFGIGGEKSGSTVESLDKWIKDLLISGEWSIGMLHGMTYGYDAFSDSEILWEHFRRVKKQEDKIWVDTFEKVSAYTKARNNVQLDVAKYESNIQITPRLALDSRLFTEPLTMVVKKNSNHTKIIVHQNGKELKVKEKNNYLIFDFNPFGDTIDIKIH